MNGDKRLPQDYYDYIQEHESEGIGVSVFSCWEVAKLVEGGRISLSFPLGEWIAKALSYPGILLLGFSPEVAVESTLLPGAFHRDPADQIIVAMARIHACPLMTLDTKIRVYPHVQIVP